jgi:hypothetical protein
MWKANNAFTGFPAAKIVVAEVLGVVGMEEGGMALIAKLADQLIDSEERALRSVEFVPAI